MENFFTVGTVTMNIKNIKYFNSRITYKDKWENRNSEAYLETKAFMNEGNVSIFKKELSGLVDYDRFDKGIIEDFHKEKMEEINKLLSKKGYI